MLQDLKFHHIGIATSDIDRTSRFYLDAGYVMTDMVVDVIQKVKISFLTKENMPQIELLEPICEDTPVTKILTKTGVTPYHICYEADDMEKTIKDLKKKHFIPLFKPVRAIALKNKFICFLYNIDVGLIEITEK
jgi:methylmalonyl-CoA/ethylmalonyl-CoA epimerase